MGKTLLPRIIATLCAKHTIISLVDLSARCRAAIPGVRPFPFSFLRDTRIRTIGDNDGKTAAGYGVTTAVVREGREELLGINAGKRDEHDSPLQPPPIVSRFLRLV